VEGVLMNKKRDELVHKFINLRNAIGILGISTPFVLVLLDQLNGWNMIRVTISNYYLSNTRDVFVGIMCVISFFFISYKGYETIDNIICSLTGIAALGVAIFPDLADSGSQISVLMPFVSDQLTSILHVLSAASFFLLLAFISICLFRKKPKFSAPSDRKIKRNIIYLVCGITIVACMILIGVCFLLGRISSMDLDAFRPIFILESIAILSFGISWMTKGGAILRDREKTS
jgi:hypothetical protein